MGLFFFRFVFAPDLLEKHKGHWERKRETFDLANAAAMAQVTAQTTDGYASNTCCGNPVTTVGLAAAPPKGFGEEPYE